MEIGIGRLIYSWVHRWKMILLLTGLLVIVTGAYGWIPYTEAGPSPAQTYLINGSSIKANFFYSRIVIESDTENNVADFIAILYSNQVVEQIMSEYEATSYTSTCNKLVVYPSSGNIVTIQLLEQSNDAESMLADWIELAANVYEQHFEDCKIEILDEVTSIDETTDTNFSNTEQRIKRVLLFVFTGVFGGLFISFLISSFQVYFKTSGDEK